MARDLRPKEKFRIPIEEKPPIRKYSIVPARAAQDDSLNYSTIRLLMAMCLYGNAAGVCWPSRQTLGRHISRSVPTVARNMNHLIRLGYIRRLEFRNTYKRKSKWMTRRYQILYDGEETRLPSEEELWAPRARLRPEFDTDEMGEFEGVSKSVSQACAASFCDGIESATGIRPQIETSLSEAARLVSEGFSPGDIRAQAVEAGRAAMAEKKPPPMALHLLKLHDPDVRQGKETC